MRRAEQLRVLGCILPMSACPAGAWGLANGYCLMAGAADAEFARLKPYLQALAPTPETGWPACRAGWRGPLYQDGS